MRRCLTPLTVAILALLLALPADGSAEPVSVQAIGIQLHAANSIYVTGTEGVDRVTASKLASNAWQVTAPGGVIANSDCAGGTVSPYQTCGCTNVDAVTANCTSPNSAAVITQLFGGSDSVRADEGVALWAVAGKGHDRLIGAELTDHLWGHEGGDRLVGGAGFDRIDGGPGHNAIFGGGGDDILDAENDDRDRVIDCGTGRDRVYIDPKLDTPESNCEEVRSN